MDPSQFSVLGTSGHSAQTGNPLSNGTNMFQIRDINDLTLVLATLYSVESSPEMKTAASKILDTFQSSVIAWGLIDSVLIDLPNIERSLITEIVNRRKLQTQHDTHNGESPQEIGFIYQCDPQLLIFQLATFAAQTIRRKIKYDISQLEEAHQLHLCSTFVCKILPLFSVAAPYKHAPLAVLEQNANDSELLYAKKSKSGAGEEEYINKAFVAISTSPIIRTQIGLTLAALVIQVQKWDSPINEILQVHGDDINMAPVMVSFFKCLPEEFNSKWARIANIESQTKADNYLTERMYNIYFASQTNINIIRYISIILARNSLANTGAASAPIDTNNNYTQPNANAVEFSEDDTFRCIVTSLETIISLLKYDIIPLELFATNFDYNLSIEGVYKYNEVTGETSNEVTIPASNLIDICFNILIYHKEFLADRGVFDEGDGSLTTDRHEKVFELSVECIIEISKQSPRILAQLRNENDHRNQQGKNTNLHRNGIVIGPVEYSLLKNGDNSTMLAKHELMNLAQAIYHKILESGKELTNIIKTDIDLSKDEWLRTTCVFFTEAVISFMDLLEVDSHLYLQLVNQLLSHVEYITEARMSDMADMEILEILKISFLAWSTLSEELIRLGKKKTNNGTNAISAIIGAEYSGYVTALRTLFDYLILNVKYGCDGILEGFSSDEKDEFNDLRHDIGAIIQCCVEVIGPHDSLLIVYKSLEGHVNSHIAQGDNQKSQWQNIEAPLFVLRAIIQRVDPESNDEMLIKVMEFLPYLPTESAEIRKAIILVIGWFSKWTNCHPQYLDFQMNMISESFSDVEVQSAACFALKYLGKDCGNHLIALLPKLMEFYNSIIAKTPESMVNNSISLPYMDICQVLVSICNVLNQVENKSMTDSEYRMYIESLCSPIVSQIDLICTDYVNYGKVPTKIKRASYNNKATEYYEFSDEENGNTSTLNDGWEVSTGKDYSSGFQMDESNGFGSFTETTNMNTDDDLTQSDPNSNLSNKNEQKFGQRNKVEKVDKSFKYSRLQLSRLNSTSSIFSLAESTSNQDGESASGYGKLPFLDTDKFADSKADELSARDFFNSPRNIGYDNPADVEYIGSLWEELIDKVGLLVTIFENICVSREKLEAKFYRTFVSPLKKTLYRESGQDPNKLKECISSLLQKYPTVFEMQNGNGSYISITQSSKNQFASEWQSTSSHRNLVSEIIKEIWPTIEKVMTSVAAQNRDVTEIIGKLVSLLLRKYHDSLYALHMSVVLPAIVKMYQITGYSSFLHVGYITFQSLGNIKQCPSFDCINDFLKGTTVMRLFETDTLRDEGFSFGPLKLQLDECHAMMYSNNNTNGLTLKDAFGSFNSTIMGLIPSLFQKVEGSLSMNDESSYKAALLDQSSSIQEAFQMLDSIGRNCPRLLFSDILVGKDMPDATSETSSLSSASAFGAYGQVNFEIGKKFIESCNAVGKQILVDDFLAGCTDPELMGEVDSMLSSLFLQKVINSALAFLKVPQSSTIIAVLMFLRRLFSINKVTCKEVLSAKEKSGNDEPLTLTEADAMNYMNWFTKVGGDESTAQLRSQYPFRVELTMDAEYFINDKLLIIFYRRILMKNISSILTTLFDGMISFFPEEEDNYVYHNICGVIHGIFTISPQNTKQFIDTQVLQPLEAQGKITAGERRNFDKFYDYLHVKQFANASAILGKLTLINKV